MLPFPLLLPVAAVHCPAARDAVDPRAAKAAGQGPAHIPMPEVNHAPLSPLSLLLQCTALLLEMQWTPVQQKLLAKALPTSKRLRSIMLEAEGVAASSTHPGDWRYKNVQYD